MEVPPTYVIDASSLIVLARHRPARKHARIWQRLDELIRSERLIGPEEVFVELKAGSDALLEWAKRYKKEKRFFKKTTRQVAGRARQLIAKFPLLIEADRPIPQADPFVVALAKAESTADLYAPQCIVVTEEKFTYTGDPKLPNVCGYAEVPYMTIHQMLIREGCAF